jgi:hypothetical protein
VNNLSFWEPRRLKQGGGRKNPREYKEFLWARALEDVVRLDIESGFDAPRLSNNDSPSLGIGASDQQKDS